MTLRSHFQIDNAAQGTTWDIYFSSILVEHATPWIVYAYGSQNQFAFSVPNPGGQMGFFEAGSAVDTDLDGLSDGYELLVSGTITSVANSPRAIYEAAITAQSPDHWFTLDDTDATPDSVSLADGGTGGGSALGNSGTAFAPDLFDKLYGAVEFDADSDVLTASDLINGGATVAPAVDQTASGSVSLLFRTPGALTGNRRCYLLSQGTSDISSKNAFHVYVADAAGGQGLKLEIGDKTTEILAANEIVFDAWYYLAITWKEDSNPEVMWYLGRVRSAINSGSIDLDDTSTHAVVGDNGSLYLGNKFGFIRKVGA